MSDLTKFSDGASILQQVDVSDIFKNLALGIAEAQQKLDDNSIAQAIKLAETQINGVSLLELGFAPVFYAFQYADISASINLKMALKEALEFGFGLDLQIAKNKGYSEDTHNFLSEDSYSETTEEYKASRQMNFRANEKNSVKINNKFVKQSEALEAKSRIEKFKHDIITQASVEQVYEDIQSKKLTNNNSRGVDIWIDNGFIRLEESLHYKKDAVGILKIGSYSPTTLVDVNGSGADFTVTTNLITTLDAADHPDVLGGGQLYGVSKDGKVYQYDNVNSVWAPILSTIYFPYNSDEVTMTKDLKTGPNDNSVAGYPPGVVANKNHSDHGLVHKVLRLIHNYDPESSITITGMTDPKGGNNPKNQSLAKRRAENLKSYIFGSTAPVNVKIDSVTNDPGNSNLEQRYAAIELDSDYLIFIDGNVTEDATPVKSSTGPNKFVYADVNTTEPFHKLDAKYGSAVLFYNLDEAFSEVVEHVSSKIESHSYEFKDGQHYFLEDESIVKFTLLTNLTEEISIEHDDESSSSGTEVSNSFLTSKTKNEKSILNDSVSNRSQDSSFALGASVDFRMSRQFEMSMEGNAAMSARLVAVPAPQDFVGFLRTVYVSGE
ncbi:hypothetical protein [uncultured Fluviicola sp.]|uniref:hypothetical protein n=1 Tax=uncultured Fluviicola sp. TaxID=463303 RepID=UPI0025DD719B|nr:hypothetical protein [uncultured Fluviicola sp.]